MNFYKKKRYFKYKTFSEFHRLLFAFLIFWYFWKHFFYFTCLWFSRKL